MHIAKIGRLTVDFGRLEFGKGAPSDDPNQNVELFDALRLPLADTTARYISR